MIRVRQIKVSIGSNNIIDGVCHKLGVRSSDIKDYFILKRSIDARDKNNILFVYEVGVSLDKKLEERLLKRKSNDILLLEDLSYKYAVTGSKKLNLRPVIVGSGPCGLFCAYCLAEAGFKPIILERGEMIEDRVNTVNDFFDKGIFNSNSNVQFGEGGAGTFSDGKLNTLVKDKLNRGRHIFEIFVECGAPEEILYDAHPHIGTDVLRNVIVNIRNKIISMGGEFRYNSCVTDLVTLNEKICGVVVNDSYTINTEVVVLAIGHSSRDTFYMLNDKGIKMKAKNFAVGVRIEHPREMIDFNQYGDSANILGSASYKLTYTTDDGRGVYSFCMCPGGYVVNASSEEGMLVVNGMSNYKRDGKNSNSAIVVTVGPKDFGNDVFSGIEFQRKLESLAYKAGRGLIPVQLFKDFCDNKISDSFGEYTPNTKGSYRFADLNSVLPLYVCNSLKSGINYFGKKIKGFNRDDAILLGVESRTSSPVVIERDENFEAISGLYPAGEGAGYAGGITTAAIDGVKVFESIIKKYKV